MPKGKKKSNNTSSNKASTKKKQTRRNSKPTAQNTAKKIALPSGALVTFGGSYYNRAQELKQAGSISEASILQAIKYDVQNFDVKAAGERLIMIDNVIAYSIPIALGWIIDKYNILPVSRGWNKVASRLLYGVGIGKFGKVVLDPPRTATTKQSRQVARKIKNNNEILTGKKVSGSNNSNCAAGECGGRFSAM